MTIPPAVTAARALIADLVSRGVQDVVLAPGSRSAPLAYAVAEAADAGRITLHVRVDERAAGFLAIGLSKGAEGAPVAVVTTSGTAVANLHPAVLEASHTGLPLILLTADRPHELRGTGASQTTDQVGIFGAAVRFAVDVPAPSGTPSPGPEADGEPGTASAQELRDLRSVTGRAVSAALGFRSGHPGPVHLNLAFRDPLAPSAPLPGPGAGSAPDGSPKPDPPLVVPAVLQHFASPALPGDPARTVVVAGDGAGPEARQLAEAQGWPLFAEPSSGATGGPNAIAAYRLLLGSPELAAGIEQAVVLGRPTLSRPVQRLLGRPDVAVTVVAPGAGPWPDAARNAAVVVPGVAAMWFEAAAPQPSEFLERWRASGVRAAQVLDEVTCDDAVIGGPTALSVARAVAGVLGSEDLLVVGSSNPVRDLELVLGLDGPGPAVLANRGLAGIDGTVSTAVGVALAAARRGLRTRALLGDLTFLHDVGGLLRGPDEPPVDLEIVVVNDDGGSIFATLEHGALAATGSAASATFERVFGTPHGSNLAQLCAGYGVDHQLVQDVPTLRHALQAPSHGVQVIEVRVPRADRLAESRDLARRIVERGAPSR
ncbi:2-succinyl-5-enolpyruvyl-6-hydroxy-3-cyclohexene-1-carboxylate synthase [Promicromonospora umidemergens]|uniref:2-succinyl-5-enolpyruvyl-6-hydroxy-3-cyclohexene-1-carboxylate synthase n=1 Tax=Promicromonospora umidemergens TaxID=629679 RepID=A0ABP8X3C6_9MICO|nr:2-succinyl-5-enolpyruvyl-6-hydroxy-3-cyclohexene-1-carboxylic-acid synthase [Promicromonospora umidemergens]MCP2286131.1 2-succinyl-5-enolpyruvyl-6-hydroxy-3-cyclohexene-1-carboxylate synthase [Promicromonospora umidemergens]